MNSIKAIETEYKGYKFRSRLEARWAVFFDSLKIQYEYEIEGFVLDDGTKYLPDFYLPGFEIFVEIKPAVSFVNIEKWESERELIFDKCRKFRTSTGKAINLVFGDPARDIWGMLFAWADGGEIEYESRFVDLDNNMFRNETVLMVTDVKKEYIYVSSLHVANENVVNGYMLVDIDRYWVYAARLLLDPMFQFFDPNHCEEGSINWARKKARQARFEYGEAGD